MTLNLSYYLMFQDKFQAMPLNLSWRYHILFDVSKQVPSNVPRFDSGIFVI